MGELDSFLARVLDARKAHHVSGHFAAGVVAPELALLVKALYAEGLDGLGGLGCDLPLEIDEIARLAQFSVQFGDIHGEQRSELAASAGGKLDVGGNRPDRLDRCGYRERFAVSVEDAAARRRHFENARIAGLALLLQEVGPQRLQVYRAQGEQRESAKQRREHEARAPHGKADESLGRRLCGAAHRAFSVATTRTRRGSGERMPSVPVAIFSTRWCRPQVLASSCRRP